MFKPYVAPDRAPRCRAIHAQPPAPVATAEAVTPHLLQRTYIRGQRADGSWTSMHCAEATDAQFDRWARERCVDLGVVAEKIECRVWTEADRIRFCAALLAEGRLTLLALSAYEAFRAAGDGGEEAGNAH